MNGVDQILVYASQESLKSIFFFHEEVCKSIHLHVISYFHSTLSAHTDQQFCLQISNNQIMTKTIARNGVDIKFRDICYGCDKSQRQRQVLIYWGYLA